MKPVLRQSSRQSPLPPRPPVVNHAGESPILLQASVTLAANQILEPETQRLANPYRTPMLIDEIRFRCATANGARLSGSHLSIRCMLTMGRAFLTNGYVPVGNFGKVLSNEAVAGTGSGTDGQQYESEVSFHCWKLAKPLFVPAGEFLVPKFQYESKYGDLGSVTTDVVYAGRSLPGDFPAPKDLWLPWVAFFDTSALAATSGQADSTLSTQTQLVNPFDEELLVQRFIGRTLVKAGGATSFNAEVVRGGTSTTTGPGADVFRDTTVMAVDSFGNILVKDPTPFTHLFQYGDRCWTVNARLSSKGFYIFQVDRNYLQTVANYSIAHAISMVGYRKVLTEGQR